MGPLSYQGSTSSDIREADVHDDLNPWISPCIMRRAVDRWTRLTLTRKGPLLPCDPPDCICDSRGCDAPQQAFASDAPTSPRMTSMQIAACLSGCLGP